MSWQAIAKKDVRDSVRAKTLWAVIVVFFLAIGGLTYLAVDGGADALEAVFGTTFVLGIFLFIPIAGLLVSIKAIVGERESGTINLLLSLPHSRQDMVLGKFLGRSAVMVAATIVGFLPGVAILLTEVNDIVFGDILALLFVASLIGVMFVAIGVGFSALVSTETRATVGGIVIFFMLWLWPFLLNQVFDLFDSDIPTFVERFWLLNLFSDMFDALAPSGRGLSGASAVTGEFSQVQDEVVYPSSPELFMQNWFAFVLLALWIVFPLAIGYARFKRIDL